MGPELHYMVAQQRGAEMRQEGDRQRLARELAGDRQQARWRSRVAQLFTRRHVARASGDYEEATTPAGSEQLTHLV